MDPVILRDMEKVVKDAHDEASIKDPACRKRQHPNKWEDPDDYQKSKQAKRQRGQNIPAPVSSVLVRLVGTQVMCRVFTFMMDPVSVAQGFSRKPAMFDKTMPKVARNFDQRYAEKKPHQEDGRFARRHGR